MSAKFNRREAIAGIGLSVIATMFPRWIYAKEIKSLPNKIVTYLNPETILINRGVSQRMDKITFNRSGNWQLPYRLWTAIGAGQADNNQSSTLGYLILEKTISDEFPGKFTLNVRQKILQQGSRPPFKDDFHYTEAHIICKDNDIATPVKWEVKQSIWRAGAVLDNCSFVERGQLEELSDEVAVKINVNNVPRPVMQFKSGTRLTSDFSLLAALPGMLNEKTNQFPKHFVMLEKLRLQKDNHLLFRNTSDDYVSNNFGALQKIEHHGNGILPFDYWLDDKGAPLFICTLHNAFIYDIKAEEIVEEICSTGKRRQFED
ncbi:MAG TPA: hypothetical protein VMV47_09625 [Bacteroidales bacterium]|nr:hypothetical protein [Bacteroidales bacterium]